MSSAKTTIKKGANLLLKLYVYFKRDTPKRQVGTSFLS